MAIDESTLQTEHDVLQSMKLEGIFDELRLACRELLYKDASYGPFKTNLDRNVESFLTQQNWKNASDYREKTRKEVRQHVVKSEIIRMRMPRLIKDIVERYSEEIIMPKLDEKVRAIIEKHELVQEELKLKNSKPEEPARAEPPLPQTVQDHAPTQNSLQAIPPTTSPSKESETVSDTTPVITKNDGYHTTSESGSDGEDDDAELTLEERLKKIMKDPIQVHSGDEGGASPEPVHNEPAKPAGLASILQALNRSDFEKVGKPSSPDNMSIGTPNSDDGIMMINGKPNDKSGATPTMDEPGAESGMNGEAIPIVEVGTSIGVRKQEAVSSSSSSSDSSDSDSSSDSDDGNRRRPRIRPSRNAPVSSKINEKRRSPSPPPRASPVYEPYRQNSRSPSDRKRGGSKDKKSRRRNERRSNSSSSSSSSSSDSETESKRPRRSQDRSHRRSQDRRYETERPKLSRTEDERYAERTSKYPKSSYSPSYKLKRPVGTNQQSVPGWGSGHRHAHPSIRHHQPSFNITRELQDAVPGSGSKDIREDSSGTPQTPQDEDSPEEGEVSD